MQQTTLKSYSKCEIASDMRLTNSLVTVYSAGFILFQLFMTFLLHNFDDRRKFRTRSFLAFYEDFSSALNHETRKFFVCAYFFENTNTKILLFPVFYKHEYEDFWFYKATQT